MTKTWEEKLAEKDKINQVRVPADLELGYKLSPQYLMILTGTNNFGHQVYLDQAPYFHKSITWMYSYEIMVKDEAIC